MTSCCNPCYNGNDLQVGITTIHTQKSCNPCYNGNDLQGQSEVLVCAKVVILVIMEMTYR